MRSTIVIQEEGFLGPFPRIVEPGDTQCLVFSLSDTGPFWMCDAEKEDCRLDKHLGNTISFQLKAPPELIIQLCENGVHDSGFTDKQKHTAAAVSSYTTWTLNSQRHGNCTRAQSN